MTVSILSGLVLVFLTMLGYSSGAVLVRRNKKVGPNLLDLAMLVVLCVLALTTQPMLGRWAAILVWFVLAGITSAPLTGARIKSYEERKRTDSPKRDTRWVCQAVSKWKGFVAEIGNYQGGVLLAFFYFTIVTPFGLLVQMLGDPLGKKHRARTSMWIERKASDQTLQAMHDQF